MNGYQASCQCGAVRLRFTEVRGPRVLCHCWRCQKSTGSAFGANVSVARDGFEILNGEDYLANYESSPGKRRRFCRQCGSPMFAEVDRDPSVLRIRLGVLDTRFEAPHRGHIFVAEMAPWDRIHDDAPQHPGWPPASGIRLAGSRQPVADDPETDQ
ncbi:MAG: GFA family protein [Burkholderiaceae bacterium]